LSAHFKKNYWGTSMKKFLIAAAGFVAFAAPALAADLAPSYIKAPPPVVAALYDWSGFYIGINGGGGSSRKCWDFTNNFGAFVVPEGCHDATGGTVGGQIGYRWQSSAWVFGLEAQGNWADFRGSNISLFSVPPGVLANRSRIDALGLFTGQVGYSWNSFLLYVKGGAAVTRDRYEGYFAVPFVIFPAGTVFDQATETRWGGVVGVGGEYAFAGNWSFSLEYDHLFMGTRSMDFTTTGVPAGAFSRTESIRQDVDMLTARVNYRFGGPVVARY
jgi:outer membrane immunogenic protein